MALLFIARLFYLYQLPPSDRPRQEMRTPEEVTLALKEACKKIVSFEHNPKDADITDMAETLTPILMEILYNPVDRAHNLWGSQLCNPTTPNSTAPSSSSPPRKKLYHDGIARDATTSKVRKVEAEHTSKRTDHTLYDASNKGCV